MSQCHQEFIYFELEENPTKLHFAEIKIKKSPHHCKED